jgi:hypothetical protein
MIQGYLSGQKVKGCVCEFLRNYLPQRFNGGSKWLQPCLLVVEVGGCKLCKNMLVNRGCKKDIDSRR